LTDILMSALAISNVVLWIVVLALLALVLALTRQIGVLHERIAPVGALMINKGLTVGEQVPVVDVADLAGQALKVGAPRTDGLSTLLLFVSPTCPVCESLLPVLRASRKQEKSWLQILLASDGDLATQREFVRDHDLGDFQYVVSAPLGMTYQVSRLPFAALVDGKGVLRARGLVNSREHLESLFEAQRLGVASLQEYFAAHG
jgi:methylamine dehydrogenase accessory protein MauD